MVRRRHPKATGLQALNSGQGCMDPTISDMNLDIEAQIRACETRLYAAMLASNEAELNGLIANDLLFVGPTGDLTWLENCGRER